MSFCTLEDIARFVRENDDFAVITHVNPDGDAFGSALGLTYILKALGKRAMPVCDNEVTPKYRFLEGWELFTNAEKGLPFVPQAAVGVDVATIDRMGKSTELFNSCPQRAVIDHHATNSLFGRLNYVEADAAAAGEIIVKLAKLLGVALTKPMAEQFYTAISTDSGNFCFKDTSRQTFSAAAECLSAGADVETLSRKLYRTRTVGETKLLGRALDSIALSPDGRVAGIMLTDEMFSSTGATRPEAHQIVNYLNEMEGVCVGFTAEQREGEVKLSFRAANGVDVSKLAQRFDGGGHVAAAGGRITGGRLEDEFPGIMRACIDYLNENY